MVQLADATGFSSHTLSMIINKKAGKNFNRFINDFRLREAEHLLKEEENISVKTIYFEVGFNNKASFYKAFKEKYNCTPLEYKQKLVN
jgi:AraC-like DNA-binding protein